MKIVKHLITIRVHFTWNEIKFCGWDEFFTGFFIYIFFVDMKLFNTGVDRDAPVQLYMLDRMVIYIHMIS